MPNSGVLFRSARIAAIAVLPCFALCAAPSVARADEFAMVAAGDASYAQLSALAKAGWLDAATVGAPASGTVKGGARTATLTRYEMALQVARAIFAVLARADADAAWSRSAPRPAARALRELSNTFRGELKGMGVDVAASQKQLELILQGAPFAAPARTPARVESGEAPVRPAGNGRLENFGLSLSQRLRVDAAASSLARDADDLFGDAAFEAAGGAAHQNANYIAGAVQGRAGIALGVTDWLTLRAAYLRNRSAMPSLTAGDAAFATPFGAREVGGGVDISLPRSLMLSGEVANVAGVEPGAASFTRLGGGLGWAGWQNRLSMKANLSRLVPGDARILPSTLVGLNVGLGVTQRLNLTLRYQQMFSAPDAAQADRLVSGGVSLNF